MPLPQERQPHFYSMPDDIPISRHSETVHRIRVILAEAVNVVNEHTGIPCGHAPQERPGKFHTYVAKVR